MFVKVLQNVIFASSDVAFFWSYFRINETDLLFVKISARKNNIFIIVLLAALRQKYSESQGLVPHPPKRLPETDGLFCCLRQQQERGLNSSPGGKKWDKRLHNYLDKKSHCRLTF